MIGAILGDIIGSRFEFHNRLSKEFQFLHPSCEFTDDTVMTCAVAQALMDSSFVLCTFKVSSSNRKQIGNYKKEAQFYWLSDQKYGMHQGSGRSRGVCGLQSAEAGVRCGEEGQGMGQPTSASV